MGMDKNPRMMREQEKRKVMGKVVKILIKTTFENHYYKFDSKVLRHVLGGPIGLRSKGSVIRMVMKWFLDRYRVLLEQHGI